MLFQIITNAGTLAFTDGTGWPISLMTAVLVLLPKKKKKSET